ncbi:MAG TPA: ANTAR domain-containing protein, partial [Propionibacteriaceae bacterium]
ETAALLIASAVPVDTSHRVGANLRQALHARDVVQTAKGVVMARDGLDEDAAFQVLVGQARTTNRVLADVARQVISTRGAERAEGAEGSIR